jgi:hypothetical protein
VATSIDDNEADEKSDKPRCQLINIRCTSVIRPNCPYVWRRINFQSARRLNESMRWHRRVKPTQSGGNLDQRNIGII